MSFAENGRHETLAHRAETRTPRLVFARSAAAVTFGSHRAEHECMARAAPRPEQTSRSPAGLVRLQPPLWRRADLCEAGPAPTSGRDGKASHSIHGLRRPCL